MKTLMVKMALAATVAVGAGAIFAQEADAQERVHHVAGTNVAPAKVVYPDVPEEDFLADDWAEELAEKAEQGIHIRNGHILVVVRMPAVEGEHQKLTKVRAKFRAIEFLRHHYPDLPKEFSAQCRALMCEMSESGESCVAVVSFAVRDVLSPGVQGGTSSKSIGS